MFYYKVFGLICAADMEFRQLVPVEATETEVDARIVVGEPREEIVEKASKLHYEFGENFSWLVNDTCWLMMENGNRITYKLKEGMNPEYLRTYILGWGMSMLALQRDTLAIHCSAIADENGALLICGESGAGKSTVTTEFLENGHHLLADDMSFVYTENGKAYATPAFPFQKLCRDAAMAKGYPLEELIYIDEDKDKFLVPYKGEFGLDPVPVKGMIWLRKVTGDEVIHEEVKGLEQFPMVANNLFLRHLLGQKKYDPAIGQLCLNVAAVVPMTWIGRPDGKDTLKEVLGAAKGFAESVSR